MAQRRIQSLNGHLRLNPTAGANGAEDPPMTGIRVADFGQYVAGPMVAMMLADQGADVTHIDPPGGLRWKSPAAAMLNRRKKCLELDLKTSDGLTAAERLLASCDVLVENFRPGVMTRLGLGPDRVRELNPYLVYLSMPGFASHDTEFAHLKAWEANIMATCGIFSDMGLNRVLMGVKASYTPLTMASSFGAAVATLGVVSALYARTFHGQGEHIEVPLAAALMDCLVYNGLDFVNFPRRYVCARGREIEKRKQRGETKGLSYDEVMSYCDPFFKAYECADQRRVYLVNPCHAGHQIKTLKHSTCGLGRCSTLRSAANAS